MRWWNVCECCTRLRPVRLEELHRDDAYKATHSPSKMVERIQGFYQSSWSTWNLPSNRRCLKLAICPIVRFWLREYCELIDFQSSEHIEPISPRVPAHTLTLTCVNSPTASPSFAVSSS